MSKTTENLLREQDNLLEYYSGFYDWLGSLNNELNEDDINKMESKHLSSLPQSNSIISKSFNPVNNSNYNPRKGKML